MNLSSKQYNQYVAGMAPKSPIVRDVCLAFLIGGAICVIGQLISNGYGLLGLTKEDAGTAASCSLVFLSALATGLSWYDDLAKYGGAGTLVPITGFANAVSSPAVEFKTEGFVTGLAAKMFTIAGPVIVYGITASVLYGVSVQIWMLCAYRKRLLCKEAVFFMRDTGTMPGLIYFRSPAQSPAPNTAYTQLGRPKSLVPMPQPTDAGDSAGRGPNAAAKWASSAAPVGVHSSPVTGPGQVGIPARRFSVAGAGTGKTPWAQRTVPAPSAMGEAKMASGAIISSSIQQPTTSPMASNAPTSWKWTSVTGTPWALLSALAMR